MLDGGRLQIKVRSTIVRNQTSRLSSYLIRKYCVNVTTFARSAQPESRTLFAPTPLLSDKMSHVIFVTISTSIILIIALLASSFIPYSIHFHPNAGQKTGFTHATVPPREEGSTDDKTDDQGLAEGNNVESFIHTFAGEFLR